MPRRRRPDLDRRSQSNVRRPTSRANRTDDQRETDRENSRIAMSELRSLVSDNEVDRLRMQRVRAHQTQQQRSRHNEIERFRRCSAPVILERAAFYYDPAINYCADKSITINKSQDNFAPSKSSQMLQGTTIFIIWLLQVAIPN